MSGDRRKLSKQRPTGLFKELVLSEPFIIAPIGGSHQVNHPGSAH